MIFLANDFGWVLGRLNDLFRGLMFAIDNIIYSLIPIIYKLFIYISELNLLESSTALTDLVSRVYTLLGIFMLFKVSFSLLQYMVDPNAFSDSSKGIGKLVTNVLVAMVLLVSVPTLFSKAVEIQSVIVESNAIGQLILGNSNGNGTITDEKLNAENIGIMARDVQFLMFGAFYTLNTTDFPSCSSSTSGNNKELPNAIPFGTVEMALKNNGQCLSEVNEGLASYENAAADRVTLASFFKQADDNGTITDSRNFSHFNTLLSWKNDNGTYNINYMPLISTACGIYIVLLLLSFTIDIGVRSIKLCFLQMVAPIAIVSYIDPKETIHQGKLHNWASQCGKVYLSLFIRLATVFFTMFLVSAIASSVMYTEVGNGNLNKEIQSIGGSEYTIWIYTFLILGAFTFAKQVPAMIESIFGIKGGDMQLNPFKNAGMHAGLLGLGGVAGAAGGLALGSIGNTYANIKKNQDLDTQLAEGKISEETYKQLHRSNFNLARSAIGGGISSAFRAGKIGIKGGNPYKNAMLATKQSTDRRNSRAAGYGFVQNTKERFKDTFGVESDVGITDEIKSKIKKLNIAKANAERDEHMAAHQMQQLMTQVIEKNPNATKSVMAAFSTNSDGSSGYDDYDSYMDSYINSYKETLTQDDANALDDLYKDLQSKKGKISTQEYDSERANLFPEDIISRQDFDICNEARKARDEADARSIDLDKKINQLQQTENYRHKGKGK
ncbi:MAG: hypothetical protein PUA73_01765 [Bacilli bacterium]|nr:hypothetical protein [Bacilli bacterium]